MKPPAAAFLATLAIALPARLLAGPGLGALLGALAATIPPAAFAGTTRRPLFTLSAIYLALVLVTTTAGLTPAECTWTCLILFAFASATTALSTALSANARRPTLAFATSTSLAAAWLTWPLWLPQSLVTAPQRVVQSLVSPHPLFALNQITSRLGLWTEQSVAYQWTNLGQDVPYTLPASPWPAILTHATLAALLFAITRIRSRSLPPV